MSSLRSKIGALLVKPALKKVLKDFDTSNHGGAPPAWTEWTGSEDAWKFKVNRDMQLDHSVCDI